MIRNKRKAKIIDRLSANLDDFLHALLKDAVSGRVGDHERAEVRGVLLRLTPTRSRWSCERKGWVMWDAGQVEVLCV